MAKGKAGKRKSQAWLMGITGGIYDQIEKVADKADGIKALQAMDSSEGYDGFYVVRFISGLLKGTPETVTKMKVTEDGVPVRKSRKGETNNAAGKPE